MKLSSILVSILPLAISFVHGAPQSAQCESSSTSREQLLTNDFDEAWTSTPFSPPSIPLAVKSPYLSTWLPQGSGTP